MNEKYEKAKELVKKYHQEHLLKFYDDLDDEKKKELLDQILTIDFDLMEKLYHDAKKPLDLKNVTVEPIDYVDKSKMTATEIKAYEEKGIEAIKANKFAVVTMAGGQGTRLEHNGPKGTFKLDVFGKGKYLFEILAENLKQANQTYKTTIPWYIMTSKQNNEETVNFLEKNNYFGYNKDYVTIFEQGDMPLISSDGKLLIGKDKKIKFASDGNGGTYTSL